MSQGYIYILDNPALHPELLKIGKTTKSVEMRARGLSTTGLPDDFRVLHSIHVPDCHLAEALIHKKLAGHRVKANREFFRVPIALAKEALDQIATIAMRDDGREALAKEFGVLVKTDDDKGLSSGERFKRQLQRCPDYLKEMFESLNAYLLGLDAVTTRIDGKGHGTIYSHGSRPFCRMDPKFRDAWIGVRIQGVDPAKIETVAKIRDRAEKYWIYLTDPGKLDQLKQVLRLAYEARR